MHNNFIDNQKKPQLYETLEQRIMQDILSECTINMPTHGAKKIYKQNSISAS
jgi:hypothetical protein